jgi:hypothetical protein
MLDRFYYLFLAIGFAAVVLGLYEANKLRLARRRRRTTDIFVGKIIVDGRSAQIFLSLVSTPRRAWKSLFARTGTRAVAEGSDPRASHVCVSPTCPCKITTRREVMSRDRNANLH